MNQQCEYSHMSKKFAKNDIYLSGCVFVYVRVAISANYRHRKHDAFDTLLIALKRWDGIFWQTTNGEYTILPAHFNLTIYVLCAYVFAQSIAVHVEYTIGTQMANESRSHLPDQHKQCIKCIVSKINVRFFHYSNKYCTQINTFTTKTLPNNLKFYNEALTDE